MKFKHSSGLTFIHSLDLVNGTHDVPSTGVGLESSRMNVPQQQLTVFGVQGQPTGTTVSGAALGAAEEESFSSSWAGRREEGPQMFFPCNSKKRMDGLRGAECSRWVGPLQEHKQDGVKRCHCLSPFAWLKTSLPE